MGRIERVNSELLKQISYVIDYELKDPRISVGMISITRVKTTPDLKYAKVYLSFYTDDKDKQKESLEIISKANGFIRNQLKNRVQLRLLPELHFVVDDSTQYGMKIDKILKDLNVQTVSVDSEKDNDKDN